METDGPSGLDGQVIVVTGGATGIGRGICAVLASRGALLAIVQTSLHQAEEAAESYPGSLGFAADISDPLRVNSMVDAVAAHFGRIDGLVNNAAITGTAALGLFSAMPHKLVDSIVDTNLKGTIWCSQSVARYFLATHTRGNIVHIASVGAFAAQEQASIYCATKAAQVSLAQSMALELAPYRIRVNAVAPGDIATESNAEIGAQMQKMGISKSYLRRTPLGRRGRPIDVGNAVAFLLSPQAAFITGTTLKIDGGFSAY